MNQNPYEAEQNDIILSNIVFEVNIAVITGVKKFDENKENTVAVSKNTCWGSGIFLLIILLENKGI